MNTYYEWDCETVSAIDSERWELDEIIEHAHSPDCFTALRESLGEPPPGEKFRVVLVRNWDAIFHSGRAWACVEDGVIDEYFHDADGAPISKVPQKYLKELERAQKKLQGEKS